VAGATTRRPAGREPPEGAPPAAHPDATLLSRPIGQSGLPGAAALRRKLARLGVATVRDLLFHLPRRYDDLREMRTLTALRQVDDGEMASARVRVRELRVEQTFRRRVQRTLAVLDDETGEAEAIWFGRRFIERRLSEGDHIVVSGRVKHRGWSIVFDNPEFQRDDGGALLHAGRIVPVYGLTAGLTAARLRVLIRNAIDRAGRAYPEYLPARLLDGERLLGIAEAIEEAHYPASFEGRDAALRRLAFDELLALQVGMVGRRRQRGQAQGLRISVPDEVDVAIREAIVASLRAKVGPTVELTPDQVRAMAEVRADLAGMEPMLRLLQGDVGSGKTAVAGYALALAASAGYQGALLAPTDLLARQHAETVGGLLEGVSLPVTLLTGSLAADARRKALDQIADGRAGVVIGTHALLQETVSFARLGLAVVDEQHRFGVEQRGQIEAKAGGTPHVLLMTATPIPRTLGQVLYADLDVSDLHGQPVGRVPIRTGIRTSADLDGAWQRVREEAARGGRSFVVVPLIAEGEGGEGDDEGDGGRGLLISALAESAVAAESEAVRLRELLAPLRVGLVHGRMKAVDRDAEMARFRDGDLDILVGTTVIEVGVDVPEATMMIVENADRFGLAQLHQLRGRVGRGTVESFCVLVSDSTDETARARLQAVKDLRDGFALAEADFELRREGDVLGLAQSGLPQLRVASLQRTDHRELAVAARRHAEELLDAAGELSGPDVERLRGELQRGWLVRIAAGEPASSRA
jgi:ATP-dependent DNA helicase RecG